ncbi:unnamed protein product, partial [Polarella glacialis]
MTTPTPTAFGKASASPRRMPTAFGKTLVSPRRSQTLETHETQETLETLGCLSPRFQEALLSGGSGVGLLARAWDYTRLRAYEHWLNGPPNSCSFKNWEEAERSLLRQVPLPVQSLSPMPALEVAAQPAAAAELNSGRPQETTPDDDFQEKMGELQEALRYAQAKQEFQERELREQRETEEAERRECWELAETLAASLREEQRKVCELTSCLNAEHVHAAELLTEFGSERAEWHAREARLLSEISECRNGNGNGIAMPASKTRPFAPPLVPALAMPKVMGSPRNPWHDSALARANSDSAILSPGMASSGVFGRPWSRLAPKTPEEAMPVTFGGELVPPPLPLPPPEHYLLTPRTGATPRTPATKKESIPIPESEPSSPTGSCVSSCWDSLDHFDRLACPLFTEQCDYNPKLYDNSEQGPLDRREIQISSARSAYSVCALYDTGAEAQINVLKNVIRDL